MMTDFFAQIKSGCGNVSSSIENSVESHAMAFAAEESRVRGGEKIEIECFERSDMCGTLFRNCVFRGSLQ